MPWLGGSLLDQATALVGCAKPAQQPCPRAPIEAPMTPAEYESIVADIVVGIREGAPQLEGMTLGSGHVQNGVRDTSRQRHFSAPARLVAVRLMALHLPYGFKPSICYQPACHPDDQRHFQCAGAHGVSLHASGHCEPGHGAGAGFALRGEADRR